MPHNRNRGVGSRPLGHGIRISQVWPQTHCVHIQSNTNWMDSGIGSRVLVCAPARVCVPARGYDFRELSILYASVSYIHTTHMIRRLEHTSGTYDTTSIYLFHHLYTHVYAPIWGNRLRISEAVSHVGNCGMRGSRMHVRTLSVQGVCQETRCTRLQNLSLVVYR